jgi:Uma2 family endonuclease
MAYTVSKTRRVKSPATTDDDKVITFEQFYEIAGESEKADLLDGKIFRDSPAVSKHGFIVTWLTRILGQFVESYDLGVVLTATVTVRLTKYQSPEPDVFFISKNRQGIILEKYVDGPPDLCVEVISKSSQKYDRGRKFVLYADHGVKEYWIVDPLRETVEFYENHDGEWVEIKADDQGRLHSKVLAGFWLKPEWLATWPFPPVLMVLQEIVGNENLLKA